MKRYRWWNSPGFRDDDGSLQWGAVLRHFRAMFWVNVWRAHNRLLDARAVLAGACNASPWTGEGSTGYAGGYSHWRCMKRRGHTDTEERMNGAHRFHNYTWERHRGARVEYAPIQVQMLNDPVVDEVLPFRRLTKYRHTVDRRSRSRYRAKQAQIALARRIAEKRGS